MSWPSSARGAGSRPASGRPRTAGTCCRCTRPRPRPATMTSGGTAPRTHLESHNSGTLLWGILVDQRPVIHADGEGNMNRKEQAAASRAELMEAARESFAELGYEGTTVAGILKRAGMARGALYHYFPGGKAEIFTAVFDMINE